MIHISDKITCSGCSACSAVCPLQCVTLRADEEGFLYPEVDTERCIHCGACEQVCPVLNRTEEIGKPQKAYLVQHRDDAIRMDSTAGGAFTAIATWVIDRGGVVFGAAYDENFQVYHTSVETVSDLSMFRNSKYVQSRMGDCFREVKQFLQEGRWVCFSGTPCQIEGLSGYLRKSLRFKLSSEQESGAQAAKATTETPFERLVLVDVVCHGIPSPLIWNRYLEYQGIYSADGSVAGPAEGIEAAQKTQRVDSRPASGNAVNRPDNIRFRDKYYGYKYSTMSIIRDGQNIYHAGSQMDPMLRAFFSDMCDRPICYECPFKKRYRMSDVTIWDCFPVYDFDKSMDDDKGTTRVLCHTEKGAKIIEQIADDGTVLVKRVEPDALVRGVKEMTTSVALNPRRDQFLADARTMTGPELFGKYFPINAKIKLKTAARKALMITGGYRVAKKVLNKIKGR